MDEARAITLSTLVRRREDVLAQPLDEDLVMADVEAGKYYGLAKTGRRVWELIGVPLRVAEVCALLLEQYAVDRETCEREVLAFLDTLHRAGLLDVLAWD